MPRAEMQQIELSLKLHFETDRAIHASDDGNRSNAVWLPRSQIEIEERGDIILVTMPEWLAKEKGLI